MIAGSRVNLALIVAVGRNGAIGKDGRLPWNLPGDLRHFRQTTRGHVVVMGRRTWQEVGKPLPGRINVVVSASLAAGAANRNGALAEGATVFASLDEALQRAARSEEGRLAEGWVNRACVFLLGGPALWQAAWPQVDEAYITDVDLEPEADTFMPDLDFSGWKWQMLSESDGPPALNFRHAVRPPR